MNNTSINDRADEYDATPISFGVPGLDEVSSRWPANRVHLLEGALGRGKTTLALQFLLEGIRR
ncbi:ATPase domain-containing protein [Paraburkholderia sp. DHOC27]|uniref:ATPase domain-containing protein n=1 Tax=Paraburkholderia sp. DHOC27 TaxID=2303330 RepID=UPI0015F3328B|nr:ATPase domain-containing protein [Paraburkholderia sp. DHOC27]